ncbi:MAG: DnaJ domain-containing protein [Bacteroidota bacterium]
MEKNYFEILEIPHDIDEEGVRKAYRVLAHKYHPDKNSDKGSHAKFMEIKEAYEFLMDPTKRKSHADALNGVSSTEALTMRYEQVRQKRASRYRRSTYERRFTYRGAHSPSTGEPSPFRKQNKEAQQSFEDSYSQYAAYYEKSLENAEKGYRFILWGFKALFIPAFLLCITLLLDLALAKEIPLEQIQAKHRLRGDFISTSQVRVITENHRFTLDRSYSEKFYKWQMISMWVTPIRKVVSEVLVKEPKVSYKIRTKESLGGFYRFQMWILILAVPFLFYERLGPKSRVHLGLFLCILLLQIGRTVWSF